MWKGFKYNKVSEREREKELMKIKREHGQMENDDEIRQVRWQEDLKLEGGKGKRER